MKQLNFKYKKENNPVTGDGECEEILGEKPSTRREEFLKLFMKLFYRLYQAKKKKNIYNIEAFFEFHGVTYELKKELQSYFLEVKPFINPDSYKEYKQLIESKIELLEFKDTESKKKDSKYWLSTLFEEKARNTHEYKTFQREINNHGYFIIESDKGKVKVYTPELVYIFATDNLTVIDKGTKEIGTLNGYEYMQTYIEGFLEGVKEFESTIAVPTSVLYGPNAEQYVRDIHHNYFHNEHRSNVKGWNNVKTNFPIILTHQIIRQYGFYSGIVSEVDAMVKKYPKLFETFDKCDHEDIPTPKIGKTLDTIFITGNGQSYIDKLTECNPKLLTKIEGRYKFIGNYKTHRGCVGQWFKFLKNKGIIDQSINRDELAEILSREIADFSINGSSIDNQSTTYEKVFQNQLESNIK